MKTTILFLMLIFIVLSGMACMCGSSEYNFYKNLSSDKPVMLVVMEDLSVGNEYNERIELGSFRLLDLIYDSGTISITDTVVIAGNNGANCGEYLSLFNIGDTLFLTIGNTWDGQTTQLFLEGCNTNYLKVENGKCKGLPLAEVIQKIDNSLGQSMSCGCGSLEFVFDFYSNVEKTYSFCFATFIEYDYSVEWENRVYQTGYFRVLDTIENFNLPVNTTIVVLGENGINCGEMFEQYKQGDSLILALDSPPFNPLLPDTFLLNGRYCGSHVLRIKNGVDKDGTTYAEIKAKMHSIITSNESFQIKESCLVYPNPFNSTINISSLYGSILKVRLFDINGRLVFQDKESNIQEKEYPLGAIPNGTYQLEIKTTNGCYLQRIVKTN